jgi:limonene-1,2-epoxide hydrolase
MSDAAPAPVPASGSAAARAPEEVVRAFLGALERLDIDAAVALLSDDAVYQNVPFPPARGRRAVEKQLRGLARFGSGFEVHYDNVASDGGTVLTERTDVLIVGPVRAAFWVCGTFEVRDGRIALWRDRFDFVDVARAFVVGAVRAVLDRARN